VIRAGQLEHACARERGRRPRVPGVVGGAADEQRRRRAGPEALQDLLVAQERREPDTRDLALGRQRGCVAGDRLCHEESAGRVGDMLERREGSRLGPALRVGAVPRTRHLEHGPPVMRDGLAGEPERRAAGEVTPHREARQRAAPGRRRRSGPAAGEVDLLHGRRSWHRSRSRVRGRVAIQGTRARLTRAPTRPPAHARA